MAIIYSYPKVTSPLATDVLVLTDTTLTAGKRKNKTKSLAMSDLAAYVVSSTSGITGSGTLNTIPLFTPSGVKLGDSIITQAVSGQGVTVTGQLDVTQDFNVTGSTELFSSLSVQGASTFSNVSFQGVVFDGGGNPGTAGQVLSSTGAGGDTEWINSTSGTVTSIALTMPSAFSVAGSPITSSGTLAVTGAGSTSQVILGDGTLGSIPGGPFLPLAGGTMTGNTLHVDNVKSIYGTGSDLEIFHDGSNSYIQETAAAVGTLNIIAKQAVAIKTTSTTNLLSGGAGSDTELSDTNGVTRLALTTSNAIFPAGNVGIGTTSPTRPLSVHRSTAGSVANFLHYTDAAAFAGLYINVDNANNIVEFNASGDTASTMAFQTGNAEKMRITSTGNVGIGTTSPDYKFEVQGVISSADASLQKATFANVGNDLVLTANANATNVTAKMLFNSSGAGGGTVSTKMIIDGSGNVGIGETNPLRKLDLIADLVTDAVRIKNTNSNGGGLSVFAANGGGGTNRILTLGDSSENVKVAVIENGNVGIGTTSPGSKLHVQGTSFFFDQAVFDDKVGIGTTSPASKLEVDGGDIEVDDSASGLILRSPDGTRYRVTVTNGGTLSVAAV